MLQCLLTCTQEGYAVPLHCTAISDVFRSVGLKEFNDDALFRRHVTSMALLLVKIQIFGNVAAFLSSYEIKKINYL